MTSQRLLLLSSEFPPGPGGIGTHAQQLAVQMSRLGWTVQVLSPQAYVDADARAHFNSNQPFQIVTLPERDAGIGWMRQRYSLIADAVRSYAPDVIVASGLRSLWTAAAVSLRFPVPWVAVGHGSEFVGQSSPARWLTAKALSSAAAVVAVSEYTAGLVSQLAAPRRMIVIPNAADGERFSPRNPDSSLREHLGLDGQRVLLTVGHVSERKAQDVVIRALPAVVERHPDVVYLMVGLPSREPELRALADELGVGQRIHFGGLVEDVQLPDFYNLSDLFVLVSRQAASGDVEGYGIVVQEAALCGKPAVVSQGCGLTEAIVEGVTGLSVPPNDPDATAAAINFLLADDDRRLAMGRQARELASQATWARRVADYDALLRNLLGLSAPASLSAELP